VRGGQTLYARGGDFVALAGINAGAGVMADGNVHVYGPLRGEVMAGASGDTKACIFTTYFAAKLVSIAGLYRNFAEGIPAEFAGKPVIVRLVGEKITLERLRLD
jgi:septum site-determining protein MinC